MLSNPNHDPVISDQTGSNHLTKFDRTDTENTVIPNPDYYIIAVFLDSSRSVAFELKITSWDNYANLELSITEVDPVTTVRYTTVKIEWIIIVKTKTSIISEAPFGMSMIVLALIGVTIVQVRKRKKHG